MQVLPAVLLLRAYPFTASPWMMVKSATFPAGVESLLLGVVDCFSSLPGCGVLLFCRDVLNPHRGIIIFDRISLSQLDEFAYLPNVGNVLLFIISRLITSFVVK